MTGAYIAHRRPRPPRPPGRSGLGGGALPEPVALHLPALGPGQRGQELDRPWVLVRGDHLLGEGLELGGLAGPAATPSRSTTYALMIVPRSGSGAPTTPASSTSGWPSRACSTSGPAML